jgi:hypothetical protein
LLPERDQNVLDIEFIDQPRQRAIDSSSSDSSPAVSSSDAPCAPPRPRQLRHWAPHTDGADNVQAGFGIPRHVLEELLDLVRPSNHEGIVRPVSSQDERLLNRAHDDPSRGQRPRIPRPSRRGSSRSRVRIELPDEEQEEQRTRTPIVTTLMSETISSNRLAAYRSRYIPKKKSIASQKS